MRPGEVRTSDDVIVLHQGRGTTEIAVRNTSRWSVQVSSHMHFFEVNLSLRFDRSRAFGMHLDIPAGRAIRWAPGEDRRVRLVQFGGERALYGFNGLCEGPASAERLAAALDVARSKGFVEEEP